MSSGASRSEARARRPPSAGKSQNAPEAAEDCHDRRDCAKSRAHAIGMGQPDPAPGSHDPDLGRPLDRRPSGGRPDRADDPDLPALGGGARSHPLNRPPGAAARLAGSARALAIYGRDGRARLHRVQRALLCRGASNERAQSVDHPGRDPGAGVDRRAALPGRPVHRAAGARRLDDHGRRRGDRRSGRPQPARGAGVQWRRRDDVHRRGSLCRLYDRVARAAPGLGLEPARRAWLWPLSSPRCR